MLVDGLELVELVMDVEDFFGISIPDRDAERLSTAGALGDYLGGWSGFGVILASLKT